MVRPFWRLLRSFFVLSATRDYECKVCNKLIHAGDSYKGYVLVSIKHHILTEREHEDCEPDDPWEEEWDNEWENWNGKDDLSSTDEELPMAA